MHVLYKSRLTLLVIVQHLTSIQQKCHLPDFCLAQNILSFHCFTNSCFLLFLLFKTFDKHCKIILPIWSLKIHRVVLRKSWSNKKPTYSLSSNMLCEPMLWTFKYIFDEQIQKYFIKKCIHGLTFVPKILSTCVGATYRVRNIFGAIFES